MTKRKKMDHTVRESETHFREIFENAVIGMYRTTPEGRILMANSALVSMLGYSSFEELARRNLEEEGYEAEYPRSDFRQRVESEGQVTGLESAWIRSDGGTVFVRESAWVVRDEAGSALYYEGTVEDVTDSKRARQTLDQSERYYRLLLDSMHEDIVVLDRDHRITDLNNGVSVTTGLERDQMLGRPCFEVLHGHSESCDRLGEFCGLRQVFATGRPHRCQHQHNTSDGSTTDVDILFSPVTDSEGNVTHVVESMRDI